MFNKNFYPTGRATIEMMTQGLEIKDKVILEPSGGKGDIVDYLYEMGAKSVISCESEEDLRMILMQKCTIVENDFFQLTAEQISHIDAIVMNPPFDKAAEHINWAYEIAPEGCEIRAICNWQTIDDDWTRSRRILKSIIANYGTEPVKCEGEFKAAERTTNVEIAYFELFKPVVSEEADYSGFFMDEEEDSPEGEGIMPYDEVRSIVQRYIGTLKAYDDVAKAAEVMNMYTEPIGLGDVVKFHISYNNTVKDREEFAKELQKKSWKWIISRMKINKFVTSGVMNDINKFVEQQEKYPFTMKNIYRMVEIIIGTRANTMKRSIVEVFDNITEHHHDNRFNVEGWKTNSHYLVNKKFIKDWTTEMQMDGTMGGRWISGGSQLDDLQKALSFIMGDGMEVPSFHDFCRDVRPAYATKIDWGHLTVRGYKKGTLHCWFKDDQVWERFNRAAAEAKGYPLPESVKI